MIHFHIIGLDDNQTPRFPEEIQDLIKQHTVFSGGLRQHEIVMPLLPANAVWIDIKAPLDNVFEQYASFEGKDIVVFASGDPLFFGFASTIRKRMPDVSLQIFPAFSSLQLLAHRLQLPYQEMRAVSVTGRSWHEMDRAFIENAPLIGLLTDHVHTPAAIASRMLEYNFNRYRMYIGTHLGNREKEQIFRISSLSEIAETTFDTPNCILLQRTSGHEQYRPAAGIPDSSFIHLDGREKMITKSPVRLLDLSVLQLHRSSCFWDIGCCTGSVSIEAKRQYPHLHIHAFEIREACKEIVEKNCRRFSAPGIDLHIGDFLKEDISKLPPPDAVFIGGHGGKLKEIVKKVAGKMKAGGTLVFNSVSAESYTLFTEAIRENGFPHPVETHITVDSYNPICIIRTIKEEK